MKKIVLAAALLLTSVATFAQHEVGLSRKEMGKFP